MRKTSEDPKSEEKSSWGSDQQKHGYYYDDNHGYEVYDPEKDEKDDEDRET